MIPERPGWMSIWPNEKPRLSFNGYRIYVSEVGVVRIEAPVEKKMERSSYVIYFTVLIIVSVMVGFYLLKDTIIQCNQRLYLVRKVITFPGTVSGEGNLTPIGKMNEIGSYIGSTIKTWMRNSSGPSKVKTGKPSGLGCTFFIRPPRATEYGH